jgi:uncharacterized lipoprotein YmbA
MIKTRTILPCFVMIALPQLVGCSGLSSANKSLYPLDVGKPTSAMRPSSPHLVSSAGGSVARDQVLQIRRVNISPPYDGLSLVYRTKGGTHVKDYYNQWVAPPEELFTTQLVDYLSDSHAFASVVDSRSAAPHRFALEMCIDSLYGDFQDTQHAKVVLAARIYLIDDFAGDRRVAYQNQYDVTIPLATASAQGLAQGAGHAYRNLLESMTHELSPFNKTTLAADGR